MRMSCNGCRVLRKGCNEDCTLRPCLQWIKSPESQANATVFLAKFYGRAGLLNLINAGPDHLRPAIFRSLLYEACGRIINPIYGSVGLMYSGSWEKCQAAVDSVLKGSPVMQIPANHDAAAAPHPIMPLKGCDIRHLSKDSNGLHRVPIRKRFKRTSGSGLDKDRAAAAAAAAAGMLISSDQQPAKFSISGWTCEEEKGTAAAVVAAASHDSFSVETVEGSLLNRVQMDKNRGVKSESDTRMDEGREAVVLELTLG